MSGWICSYRAIWEHPIFKGNAQRVGVWDWMLKTAAWKPKKFNAGGAMIVLERGQLCISQAQVTAQTGMARQQFRTLIQALAAEGAINHRPATKSTKSKTLITICNYSNYQSNPDADNQAPTNSQPIKEQGNNITTLEAKASLSAGADEREEISQAINLFRAAAKQQGWPTIRAFSKARSAALRARLREGGGLDGWAEALRLAAASDHCNGGNSRGWICNFDFLTRQSTFTKLMEGNYDNRTSPNGYTAQSGRSSPHGGLMAGFFANLDPEPEAGQPDCSGYSSPENPGHQTMDSWSDSNAPQPRLRVINPG